jgi:hypothetical protein
MFFFSSCSSRDAVPSTERLLALPSGIEPNSFAVLYLLLSAHVGHLRSHTCRLCGPQQSTTTTAATAAATAAATSHYGVFFSEHQGVDLEINGDNAFYTCFCSFSCLLRKSCFLTFPLIPDVPTNHHHEHYHSLDQAPNPSKRANSTSLKVQRPRVPPPLTNRIINPAEPHPPSKQHHSIIHILGRNRLRRRKHAKDNRQETPQ